MPINHIISDWNGTLFQDRNDGELWGYVGIKTLNSSFIGSVPTPTTLGLFVTMLKLKKLVKACKKGETGCDKIYEIFNARVLSMVPPKVVQEWADEYARQYKTQAKLDSRLLNPIAVMREEKRARAAVLSTAYDYAISGILAVRNAANGHEPLYPFYELIANPLVPEQSCSRFDLRIYTPCDKADAIKNELPHYQMYATLYVTDGDAVDSGREKCIEYVKERHGKIAVPFFAEDEFRQRAVREYDAFVPESEQDFLNFLRKV